MHEWGTFTTFSGSDGVFMDYRPLAAEHSDLPDYVRDRGSYSNFPLFSKSRIWGRVRMETPVTYFYTDRVRTVDVRVDFPEGLLTEFYPPVRQMLPAVDDKNIFGSGEAIGNSRLNWGKVDLIPTDHLLPGVTDESLRQQLTTSLTDKLLPHAANEQHYAAARETDAALVHVHGKAAQTPRGRVSLRSSCSTEASASFRCLSRHASIRCLPSRSVIRRVAHPLCHSDPCRWRSASGKQNRSSRGGLVACLR